MTPKALEAWRKRVIAYLKRKHAAEKEGLAFTEPWPAMTKAERQAQARYYSLR